MKAFQARPSRIAVVTIALAAAALTYLDASGSVAGHATAPADSRAASGRSPQANGVEAEVARTGLVAKLEAVLGDDFGGVWFDPSTAQLHVGVTSPASRRNAEAVAVQAGLAARVVEDAVDSTWAELDAAQDRWDRRLGDLLGRAEVTTSLVASRNSVKIKLGSAVPPEKQVALKLKAASEGGDVLVVISSRPRLGAASVVKKCNKFEPEKAYCDPTIVSGVTMDGGKNCTAGPPTILKKPASEEDATETFVLTAGHCISAIGEKQYAYNKAGPPNGKQELGKALTWLNDETDIGVVEMDTASYWGKAKDPIPVDPTVAAWDSMNETDAIAIEGEGNPAEHTTSCISGQRSGTKCGTVKETGITKKVGGVTRKEIVELELQTGKAGKGDSGAPVLSDAFPGTVQGVLIAADLEGGTEEGRVVYFHTLATALKKLSERLKLDLELLKTSNERRHKHKLKSAKYPVTIHGVTSGIEQFTTAAGSVECELSLFHAVLSEESSTVAVTPEYKECVGPLGVGATIDTEECTFRFYATKKLSGDNYQASVEVGCPAGQSIKLSVATCKAEVKPQIGLATVDVIDDTGASPKKDVTVRPTVEGIAYTVTQDGFLCPFNGLGVATDGKYTNTENITATGQSPTEPTEKIDIEVVDE